MGPRCGPVWTKAKQGGARTVRWWGDGRGARSYPENRELEWIRIRLWPYDAGRFLLITTSQVDLAGKEESYQKGTEERNGVFDFRLDSVHDGLCTWWEIISFNINAVWIYFIEPVWLTQVINVLLYVFEQFLGFNIWDDNYILRWPSVPCFLFLAASIEKLIASQNPAPVGSDVTLFSPPNVKALVWMFESDVIALMLNGGAIISDNWIPRVTLHSNSSLTLNSVKQNDSGSYSLAVLNSSPVKLTLSVQGKTHFSLCWQFPSIYFIPVYLVFK